MNKVNRLTKLFNLLVTEIYKEDCYLNKKVLKLTKEYLESRNLKVDTVESLVSDINCIIGEGKIVLLNAKLSMGNYCVLGKLTPLVKTENGVNLHMRGVRLYNDGRPSEKVNQSRLMKDIYKVKITEVPQKYLDMELSNLKN